MVSTLNGRVRSRRSGVRWPRASPVRLPSPLIGRPRLEAQLADGARHPVTLISAPPGWGKTTLVTSWFTHGPNRAFATLTVDERDNDPEEFASAVAASLLGPGAVAFGELPGAAATTLLDIVFAEVERRGRRVVLVVDDLQELISGDSVRTLAYLVERLPAPLELVLCTRADPPLRLSRLRMDGQLGEIRGRELAFSLSETAQLLGAHGLRLARSHLRDLWRRTEGWVAGLRLAACALQAEDDPGELVQGAATTDLAIADYLLEDLFARQDHQLQQFMLRTSVVERLTPDLAEELADDPKVTELLAELERNGIVSTERGQPTWYRFQRPFGPLLASRLRVEQPGLAEELHRRAAAWFLSHHLANEAEAHAQAARDWTLKGHLAAERWQERVLSGGEPGPGLLDGIPDQAIAADDDLVALAGVDACLRDDRAVADARRAWLDRRSNDQVGPPGPGGSNLTRALLDITYARAFGVDDRARRALAVVTEAGDGRVGAPVTAVATLQGARFDLDDGRIASARRNVTQLVFEPVPRWVRSEALAVLALTDALDGNIGEAVAHAEEAFDGVPAVRPACSAMANLARALCHAMRGEPPLTLEQVPTGEPPILRDRWLRDLHDAVDATRGPPGAEFVRLDADVAAHPLVAKALISLGVLEAVTPTGHRRVLGGPAEHRLLRARQRWRRRDGAGVIAAFETTASGLAQHRRTAIERACLLALARAEQGDDARVVALLGKALSMAEASGILAPLLVLSADLAELLTSFGDALGAHQTLAFELVDRTRNLPDPVFLEPLTDRETVVLRHLPSLMSNDEIAATMHVSVNTVKTHLKALYRKLCVTSRREAVRRGQTLGLL